MENQTVLDDVFISILTGARPSLLNETLKSLPKDVPENCYALLNGNDFQSQKILTSHNIDFDFTENIVPIGSAISFLADMAKSSYKDYWLHIEDDWQFNHSLDWLQNAKILLTKSSQVRLRHVAEKVLSTHMITGKPINWKEIKHGFIGNAHITFNPFLMKTTTIDAIFPCKGERDAQKNALKNKMMIVTQLNPGNFIHIGDKDSLRLKTNCLV